jgi:Tol biopolymer transport system component
MFAVSDQEGSLAYIPNFRGTQRRLVWIDRDGNEEPIEAVGSANYGAPSISPDGTRLAFHIGDQANADLWLHDIGRGTTTRLTFDYSLYFFPSWAGSNDEFYYGSTGASRTARLMRYSLATGASVEAVASTPDWDGLSVSADGRFVAIWDDSENDDIYRADTSTGEVTPLLNSSYNERLPAISPDGKWIAYDSDESGRPEIYVAALPDLTSKTQVSPTGGIMPLWSRDGSELFYLNDGKLVAVSVTVEPRLSVGTPVPLFDRGPLPEGFVRRWYDVSPDGERFLFVRAEESQPSRTEIVFVQNWSQELKRRAPSSERN